MTRVWRTKLSIGVDVELVERFARFERQRDHRFLRRAFFASEVRSCLARASPAQHLAARWAAKEAVIKALSHFENRGVHWRNIEIIEAGGVPRVRWHSLTTEAAVAVSLSHSGGVALAVALVHEAL